MPLCAHPLTSGYWIATCEKMRYKGEYAPSFLLDPGTHEFHPLTTKLDKFLQVHRRYTPFEKVEGLPDGDVREEWEAQRKVDGVMAELHEPRHKRAGKLAATEGGSDDNSDDNSDAWESESDQEGPTEYPSPPPPGFGDPSDLGAAELDKLLVFLTHGDRSDVLPYAAFRSSLTPVGRRMTKELVAAVGPDMFASGTMQIKTKALIHFG